MALWSISIAGLLALAVFASDLYARRVPNKALLLALCLGAVVLCIPSAGENALLPAFRGLALGLVALLPFYVIGWMGAGDVKYFAVLGFLLGAASLVPIWLVSMISLCAHGAALYMWRRTAMLRDAIMMANLPASAVLIGQWSGRMQAHLVQAQGQRKGMPYAAHLSISTLIWLAWGNVL